MRPMMLLAATALPFALPSVAHADAVLDSVRRQAAEASAPAFERQVRTEGQTMRGAQPSVRVDRFDPGAPADRQWTLVSVDGRKPDAAEIEAHRREVTAQPVPGFHRVATLLAGTPTRTEREGTRVRYRWAHLAPGALGMHGPDFSAQLSGEALVDTAGDRPRLMQVRVRADKPFTIMMMAKMHQFDAVSDYRPGAGGVPFLTAQETRVHVTIPFKGETDSRSTVSFRPL